MKKALSVLVTAAGILAFSAGAVLASECPKLVSQGRSLVANVKDASQKAQIEKLLNEAEKLHKDGNHEASVETANKALGMLK